MKTVGIISKPNKPELREIVPALVQWFTKNGVTVLLDRETTATVAGGDGVEREKLAETVDLLVVLGGDGTLLAGARAVGGREVPVLAVNLGSLGFLTEITLPEMYSALELVQEGRYEVDCRHKLMVELRRGTGGPTEVHHALNDAVLTKSMIARMMDFDAYLDGEFVSNFKADGLIVATPTGSTAYSLSAGGPIVMPAVDSMVLTPIAPHTLTNRPLVVPNRSVIEVLVRSQEETVLLTVDGQVGMKVQPGDRLSFRLSPQVLRLVRPPGRGYFEVLRNKLHWGHR